MTEVTSRWPAPAKLNLLLHITGRRPDGYHELQTAFVFLDRADQLAFQCRSDGEVTLQPHVDGVATEDNLVVRAARLLQQAAGIRQGVDITLDKVLPMGAGLGGGSSDAATTLVALNELWSCGYSVDALAQLGLSLGADVPVFVRGQACWAEGVGEIMTPVSMPSLWFVVLVPNVHIETAALFSSPELTRDCSPITIRDFLAGRGGNVFQPVAAKAYVAVAEAIKRLNQVRDLSMLQGRQDYSQCEGEGLVKRLTQEASLTGTGSCVFLAARDETSAQHLLAQVLQSEANTAAQTRLSTASQGLSTSGSCGCDAKQGKERQGKVRENAAENNRAGLGSSASNTASTMASVANGLDTESRPFTGFVARGFDTSALRIRVEEER